MTDDPYSSMKAVGQDYIVSTGDDFGKEEQDEKKDRVDNIVKESEKLQDDIRRGYYLMSTPEKPSWIGTAYLYDKAFEVFGIIIHRLKNEGEEEMAKTFRREARRVAEEIANPSRVARELDRSQNSLNHISDELDTLLQQHSNQMRQFANWVFTGTVVTKEGEEKDETVV